MKELSRSAFQLYSVSFPEKAQNRARNDSGTIIYPLIIIVVSSRLNEHDEGGRFVVEIRFKVFFTDDAIDVIPGHPCDSVMKLETILFEAAFSSGYAITFTGRWTVLDEEVP